MKPGCANNTSENTLSSTEEEYYNGTVKLSFEYILVWLRFAQANCVNLIKTYLPI